MVDPSPLNLVTAIGNSENESFVAGTLFGQGWNVNFRALDLISLQAFTENSNTKNTTLVISTDLEGLLQQHVLELKRSYGQVFLFASGSEAAYFSETVDMPTNSLDLIGLIRGSLRAPMTQKRVMKEREVRAKVIAVASAGTSTGCTTLAINLAHELSLLNKKVQLIDANTTAPSIALLLGQRGLHSQSEVRNLSAYLSIFELTQANISQGITLMNDAIFTADFLIIDLGTLDDFHGKLVGRRWSSEALIWVTNTADELWVLGTATFLGIERMRETAAALAANAIRPSVSFFLSQQSPGKSGAKELDIFNSAIGSLPSFRREELPLDARSVKSSHSSQLPLHEIGERCALRKSIAYLASQLSG